MTKRSLLMVANQLDSFFNHRLPQAIGAIEDGFDVHVAMEEAEAASTRADALDLQGLTFHHLPLTRGFANPLVELESLSALNRLVHHLRPGIIHAYTLKPVLYAGLVTRRTGTPLAASVTGVGSFFLGTSARDKLIQSALLPALKVALAGNRACRVIVQNPDDQKLVTGPLAVPTAKTRLIRGSGVDPSAFAPASPPPAPPVRVILAARMLADKGVREFVEAARQLKAKGLEAEFILAGGLDPANRSAITESEINSWTHDGVVMWTGHVADMAALNRSAHIACLPSYREGLPKSLLEAASCALPIVTTNVPGCRDAIVDGETGLLVPARSTAPLADALARLITDADLRTRMGRAGRAYVEAGLSVEAVVSQTLRVYGELLGA
ncbi:glycosyltransferase family 4 protein [Pyruvatibacter mobilis]|uniref:glycosyltransferase family 4 protein n=1 Tax=Pyruvatibacter mobilis TaxID=1712261 RepID=UPI003BA8EF43